MGPRKYQTASMGEPEQWLVSAKSNLKSAKNDLKDPDVLPELICFNAQQAVEKSLKALLLFYNVEFELVHDISYLLKLLEQANVKYPQSFETAKALTPYATFMRYPEEREDVVEPVEVNDAITTAEDVVAWIESLIKKGTLEPPPQGSGVTV